MSLENGTHHFSSSKPKRSTVVKNLGKGSIVLLGILAVVGAVLFYFVLRPAYSLVSNVNQLKSDANNIQNALTSRDLLALESSLDKTEKDLLQLRKDRDSKVGWAKNFGLTKAYYADSEHFINAGLHAVAAGREFQVLVVPFADALGFRVSDTAQVEELGLAEAFAAWVSAMPLVADDSDAVLLELSKVGEELSYVDASRYPENFQGIALRDSIKGAQDVLTQINDFAPDIKQALVIVPDLLGVNTGEKRYMIIMQNDKEIRATGGFWTYISTFKVSNGLLNSDFTSYNSYYVDEVLQSIDAFHTFPKVPPAYETHLKVERMFARDANISPDLPTSVDQFYQDFWLEAQPLVPNQIKSVDGVITIDTKVLEELLEVTGPATVNGVTYTQDNVVLELEKLASLALAEQVNRKQILGDLMQAMLVNVFESESNLWPKIIEKGFDLALRKHVNGVLFDPSAQALLEKHGFSNRIKDPVTGDYAYVVSTNLGGDKTNWFVTKDVTHTLTKEGDRYVRTVKLDYKYTRPSSDFDPFVKRFRDWVRVYVPQGSELISVEGSEDTTGEGSERNKTYFHGFVTLGPDETKSITFKYYLPNAVVKNNEYSLYIQKQSGIDVEKHHVVVNGKTTDIELKWDEQFKSEL
ncbi:MAG: DUF4012 domain-containing protein [Patescibacteria group bacterium]|uniref:DUF4012 domain-containing protein n=1 Tax=candidate division WWE3 bacterium TaxID=2053526 RepID=A0A955EFL2_UNCKA|nr:DUF4012 domain-containing protein [candidate division WWE3 bacterium]MCB0367880.1 DUF4012 domain-containing protein [Bdellovibrionales bacterium]